MERFEGAFHQSDCKSYLRCPRSFYYNRVLNLDKEQTSMAALAGTAGHFAIEYAHDNDEWRPEKLFSVFTDKLEAEKSKRLERGMDIHGDVKPEKYQTMLREYAAKPWNRNAKILLQEAEFYFEIKPSKTVYQFTGRIDQLVEIDKHCLIPDFPRFKDFPRESVIIHRDIKFGQRRECSKFELALDTQFDVYAYALKYGTFTDYKGDQYTLNLIPDAHVKYHVEDHIPYESDAGTYLKDPETGARVPCDLVTTPCLVGKTQKPCEGKRAWCTKQRRGPGMYFTVRPQARLNTIPGDLGRVCASIRMGHYPRQLGQLCFSYCQFKNTCQSEVLEAIEADVNFMPDDESPAHDNA